MKTCNKCKIEKEINFFGKDKSRPDGFSYVCKQCLSKKAKEFYIKNSDKIKVQQDTYYKNNKDKKLNRQSIYIAYKKKTDINYKLSVNLRCRLAMALKRNNLNKVNGTTKYIGCSVPELKNYLESKFTNGMDWSNYGKWEIDHIYPISKVDLSKEENIHKSMFYKNLQPLWKSDNIRKGNKILTN